MKWLKRIGIALLVVVVLFVGISLFLPGDYNVVRSVTVAAGPDQVHELVGDLTRWPEWTPWKDMDPTIETTYGDLTTGVGAHQEWTGDSGTGELTFTECDPASGVTYDLAFNEGDYESEGTIRYEIVDGGTRVTWTMSGQAGGIIGRYFGLMMDRMVGPAFESGLAKLKTQAETLPTMDTDEELPADAALEEAAG